MPWLVLVLLAATFIALLRGGRLSNFGDIQLKMWWLLPLGFGIQAIASFLPDEDWAHPAALALILSSYVPLVIAVAVNRSKPGMLLAGLGILANFTVIAGNGGMPVLGDAIRAASDFTIENPTVSDLKHVPYDEDTILGFLADVIPLRIFGQGHVISLGDVLLAIGLGVFLEGELRKPVRWFKHRAASKSGSGSAYRE
jgi:hypothetical protein